MAGEKKKAPKKPSTKILGTGAARKAGDALKNRKKSLEDKLKEAGASNTRTKKKKKGMYA